MRFIDCLSNKTAFDFTSVRQAVNDKQLSSKPVYILLSVTLILLHDYCLIFLKRQRIYKIHYKASIDTYFKRIRNILMRFFTNYNMI